MRIFLISLSNYSAVTTPLYNRFPPGYKNNPWVPNIRHKATPTIDNIKNSHKGRS